MAGTAHFHWDDLPSYGDAKADRRILHGKGGDFKRVCVKAGTVAAQHEHDFEQFFLVQEGTGELTCADCVIALRPGVIIHFQPHAWHRAVFFTDTVLIEVNFAKQG